MQRARKTIQFTQQPPVERAAYADDLATEVGAAGSSGLAILHRPKSSSATINIIQYKQTADGGSSHLHLLVADHYVLAGPKTEDYCLAAFIKITDNRNCNNLHIHTAKLLHEC